MGIDNDADVDVVGVSEEDVGGFTSDAGESEQLVHGARDLPVVFLDDGEGSTANGSGFVSIEAAGLDDFLDVALSALGECFGGGIFFKECWRGHVDAFISALRGEDGRDEQLKRVFMNQRTMSVGVGLIELFINASGTTLQRG